MHQPVPVVEQRGHAGLVEAGLVAGDEHAQQGLAAGDEGHAPPPVLNTLSQVEGGRVQDQAGRVDPEPGSGCQAPEGNHDFRVGVT